MLIKFHILHFKLKAEKKRVKLNKALKLIEKINFFLKYKILWCLKK